MNKLLTEGQLYGLSVGDEVKYSQQHLKGNTHTKKIQHYRFKVVGFSKNVGWVRIIKEDKTRQATYHHTCLTKVE